jgi:EmrB/QacA subfamily drug resistance transporter
MQTIAADAGSRRWWILVVVVAAQFMFVLDAFVVNVAIPSIRADLHASTAEIEAVIAMYQIAYATMVITGGRLGDVYGRRRMFLSGLFGFVVASLFCGLAQSGVQLVLARLAQGAAGALITPQVLATIHTLFRDGARGKAFGIFGTSLGLGAAAGLLLGGFLVTLNIAGLGWRPVFLINIPVGLVVAAAALWVMPRTPKRADVRLDLPGAALMFVSLTCLIGPLLLGREMRWAWWLWLIMAIGMALQVGFLRLQRITERRGRSPLIDMALLDDKTFLRGLCATSCLFAGNISFYLVVTLFLQNGLRLTPMQSGITAVPMAIAFIIGARQSAGQVARLGVLALMRGCAVQLSGLAATGALIALQPNPSMLTLMLPLSVFGYGQGLVMAPLFATVLATVRTDHAGSGSGILTTTQQVANGVGVAVIGAVYFGVQAGYSDRPAMLAAVAVLAGTIVATASFLERMRRAAMRAT